MGPTISTAGFNALIGATILSPSSLLPVWQSATATIFVPCNSAGIKGSGGAVMNISNVDISLGRLLCQAEDFWAYLMQTVFKRCNNAEIASSTSDGPEQILILFFTGSHHIPVCSHNFYRNEVIYCHTILSYKPSYTSSQGQTSYSRRTD